MFYLTAGATLEIVTLRGDQIQYFRESRGFTTEQLAEMAQITPPEAILEFESHIALDAPLMVAVRLAQALGVPITAICADESYVEEVKDTRINPIEGIH